MTMETGITRAWQQQAWWLWLLWPISALYGLIIRIRRLGYQLGWFQQYKAPVPVLVIGNITVGGSGKTPLIITLVSYLQHQGIKVGVISRGYGGNEEAMPLLVDSHSHPSQVGDEPCLIVAQTGVPMAVCPNRQQAIETLLSAHADIRLIIADDGLQHYALARDLEWIVVDESRGFGNRQLLPTGFLREPIRRLKDATVIWHRLPNHEGDQSADNSQATAAALAINNSSDNTLSNNKLPEKQLTMHLTADSLCPLISRQSYHCLREVMDRKEYRGHGQWQSIAAPTPKSGMRVHAISGIGYPKRFFATLKRLGFQVIEHPYPDHFAFTWQELNQYSDQPIIMTSKDAVKFRVLAEERIQQAIKSLKNAKRLGDKEAQSIATLTELLSRLWVLPVTADLSADCYKTLQTQLQTVGITI